MTDENRFTTVEVQPPFELMEMLQGRLTKAMFFLLELRMMIQKKTQSMPQIKLRIFVCGKMRRENE